MAYINRKESITALFPGMPKYRLAQIEAALFDPAIRSWNEVSTLPEKMRAILSEKVPFISVSLGKLQAGDGGDTHRPL